VISTLICFSLAEIKIATDFSSPDYKSQLPIKRIEGVNMPALQLNMSDGTLCDLNGEPRNTRVLYVCDARGKHELYSLEEISTCEYEIVVLSPLLCEHPDFK
jgi:endoplasmic reticulum lectin 1